MYYVLETEALRVWDNRSPEGEMFLGADGYDDAVRVLPTLVETQPGHDLKYLRGMRLSGADVPVDLKLVSDKGLEDVPDCFASTRAPVGSKKMLDALASAGVDNVVAYPAPIQLTDRIINGYFVLNVVGRMTCMDMKRSKYSEEYGLVVRIGSLAIDEKQCLNMRLFRLHEYQEIIVVSELVHDKLKDVSGVHLSPADGWNDKHQF